MRLLLIAPLLVGCVGPALFVDSVGDGKGVVSSDPAGIECGGRCAMVAAGRVTLAATPANGTTFVGWDGACTGTDTCVVDMVDDIEVTARFALDSHLLTIIPSEGGSVYSRSGIDCGEDCNELLKHGTRVELTPLAKPGYSFRRWTNLECEASETCVLDVVEPRELFAEFALDQPLTVSIAGSGQGSVTFSPSGITTSSTHAMFPFGSVVTLHANASAGSVFAGWGGDCAGTQSDCTLSMTGARNVTMTFSTTPTGFDPSGPCTQTVGANESATTFALRLKSLERICLAPGIEIAGTVTVPVGVASLAIRGLPGAFRPRLSAATGNALEIAGHPDIHLVNLVVRANGTATPRAISMRGGSLTIRNSDVVCASPGCQTIESFGGARIDIVASVLTGTLDFVMFAVGSTISIADSAISASGVVLGAAGGSLSLLRCTVDTTGIGPGAAIQTEAGTKLSLVDSTVRIADYDVIVAQGSTSATVTLDGNRFRKAAGSPAGSYSPLRSTYGGNAFHSTVPNSFCNEGTAAGDGELAMPWIDGAISSISTFNDVAHTGPTNCP